MTPPSEVVFLFDVDNTLLDNDRVQDDLRNHLERGFGAESRDWYWAIFEELRAELGCREDYRTGSGREEGGNVLPAEPTVF